MATIDANGAAHDRAGLFASRQNAGPAATLDPTHDRGMEQTTVRQAAPVTLGADLRRGAKSAQVCRSSAATLEARLADCTMPQWLRTRYTSHLRLARAIASHASIRDSRYLPTAEDFVEPVIFRIRRDGDDIAFEIESASSGDTVWADRIDDRDDTIDIDAVDYLPGDIDWDREAGTRRHHVLDTATPAEFLDAAHDSILAFLNGQHA